ncbi:MAG: hypothetical protein PHV14_04825 [Bacteroidales bacterium]|nr:hypothetical protein [Bacteroidales bacterium]MDD4812176.1 hypothetical protein [Bacteroidales bacterium]
MKTRTKLLFALGFVAALLVGYVIGILVDYPTLNNQDLAGTVGKAKKFRKTVLTAEDVRLRTDLMKDTAQLRTIIQSLTYYSMLTEETNKNLNMALIAFRSNGMGGDESQKNQLDQLSDFAEFLHNGNESLGATLSMLSNLYFDGDAAETPDVEKNLRDFGNFVTGLDNWGEALNQGVLNLDQFMLDQGSLQEQMASVKELKSIRDKLVISSLQLAAVADSKQMVNLVLSQILSRDQLNLLRGQDQLNLLRGQENLSIIIEGTGQLDNLLRSQTELGSAIAYDADLQLFLLLGKEQLQAGPLGQGLNSIMIIFNNEQLSFLLPSMNLIELTGISTLNAFMSRPELNLGFFSQESNLNLINNLQGIKAINGIIGL